MRCPICRAENGEESSCRRCRADLTLLAALELQRRGAITAGRRAAGAGRGYEVIRHGGAAWAARAGQDAARLLALGYFLERDFALARHWHQIAEKNQRASACRD